MILRASKYLLIVVPMLIAWLFIKSCDGPEPDTDEPLGAAEELHVTVADRVVTVRTKTETQAMYVPDGGSANVSLSSDGTVDLRVASAGLNFRPVLGALITSRLNFAVGVQIAHWNRAEIYVGGVYPLAAFIGAGYRLDQLKLNNTSVYLAYTTRKELGAGLMVRF